MRPSDPNRELRWPHTRVLLERRPRTLFLYCKGGSERGEMTGRQMCPGMSWGVAQRLGLGLKTMPGLRVGLKERLAAFSFAGWEPGKC